MSNPGYAGDLDPVQAWDLLKDQPEAVLVDCRTDAEWAFVGLPDLSALGKRTVTVAWKIYPGGTLNPNFMGALAARGVKRDRPVLFLCRSGQRSLDAAAACASAGYRRCYNVSEGFEGPLDAERHRGLSGGWKARGLPWVQS